MRKSHLLADAAYRAGVDRLLDTYWGAKRITVLAYHRITEAANSPDFPYFHPNVSAAPELFAQQMAYVERHFNVIDMFALRDFIYEGSPLPPRPLLITFDDGYLDNYTQAFPVLRRYGFPAVIFLLTSRIDEPLPPWWDECAYYFYHTAKEQAVLPLLGTKALSTKESRLSVRREMIAALKRLPETEKLEALELLRRALAVEPPSPDPDLFMNWEQIRELVANHVACQPHTVTHPILARLEPDEKRRQITASGQRVREETGQELVAFAYTNGQPGDYDRETMTILQEEGYALAFTLVPGPMRAERVREHPLEIQRVYLGRRDTLPIFAMKTMGLPALLSQSVFVGE